MTRFAMFVLLAFLLAACQGTETKKGEDDTGSGAAGTDTGTGTGLDAGADTGSATDTGAAHDYDSDGYTPGEGDCNDYDPGIGPGSVEDLGDGGLVDAGDGGAGDGIDNDCDGKTDEVDVCDCPDVAVTAEDLAAAMNLCNGHFLLSASLNYSSPQGQKGYDTPAALGDNDCLVARHGCELAELRTGPVTVHNPNVGTDMGGTGSLANDPKPKYQGSKPAGGLPASVCDLTQLVLQLKAPNNAKGFSFDFLFGSAEYSEWMNLNFNDTFYAILEYSKVNGGATTNIAFDDNGNEMEVDSKFFENAAHPCDEKGSGWEKTVFMGAGTTGWLRTTWSVDAGDTFTLTLSIHDEQDCAYDSMVLLDNFQWKTKKVDNGTVPVE
jgi:hypothetical protein